ncbi:MAG: nucleotide sugar dehydrogenase, partial [Planctomycetota bacterium]|nr:nucleotide sugar dehydrogenase [Planctomycetota bacterium]
MLKFFLNGLEKLAQCVMDGKELDEVRGYTGFKKAIESHKVKAAVVGCGYVGLPLALTVAESGFYTLAVDIDEEKLRTLRSGRSYLKEVADEEVKKALSTKRFIPSSLEGLKEADIILICVPTPLDKHKNPDLSAVVRTSEEIAARMHLPCLVILESTTYPCTTEEVVRPILDATGAKLGRDYFLAFSPHRYDPGNKKWTVRNIPKVVGGVDDLSGELAELFYSYVVDRVVRVSSARCAEAVKMLENIFRAVNIALVNEVKVVLERLNIDPFEVVEAAATKPFGFMPFYPGPGFGGHCIPLDPYYFVWKAKEVGYPARFIELAGEVNRETILRVFEKLLESAHHQGIALQGKKLLIMGVSYKKDIGDTRESPAFALMRLLKRTGADLLYHDPLVPKIGHL